MVTFCNDQQCCLQVVVKKSRLVWNRGRLSFSVKDQIFLKATVSLLKLLNLPCSVEAAVDNTKTNASGRVPKLYLRILKCDTPINLCVRKYFFFNHLRYKNTLGLWAVMNQFLGITQKLYVRGEQDETVQHAGFCTLVVMQKAALPFHY